LRVGIVTSTAVDEPLLEALAPYAEIVSIPAEQTTTFENIYEPGGRKQYVRGIAAPISARDIPAHFLRAPLVHLAPIIGEGDPQIAHMFRNATVLLTLQGWLRRVEADGRVRFKRWFDPYALRSIDIVVFSEEDIVEAPDMEQAFAQSVSNLFVTRAERGGTYYRNGEPNSYGTPQVEVINPTGAGDVFAAALLASLPALNQDFFAATKVAAHLGAISVTRFALEGAPTPQEAQAALQEAIQV
jgi:sugar/nucleoside kinase (ribokinase family)